MDEGENKNTLQLRPRDENQKTTKELRLKQRLRTRFFPLFCTFGEKERDILHQTFKAACSQIQTLHTRPQKEQDYICSCKLGFPIKLLPLSSRLPFWQLPAYICLNLSSLSRVQRVNEHSHFPALTPACRWGCELVVPGKFGWERRRKEM